MKLTEELIAQASDTKPVSSVTDLTLPNKKLNDISCLKELANLVRLDLSHNCLRSIKALSNCRSLKWLSVASNDLQSLDGIEILTNLVVLNCSCNKLTGIREVENLFGLRALIANDNELNTISKLQNLTALNTLVLSKNPISSFGAALECVPSLNKLSLSNCELQELGSIKRLVGLKELRLAHNNLKYLSKELAKNVKLQIIDLGSNSFERLSDIEVLSSLPYLKNLNVRGNPFCLHAGYEEKLKTLLPALRVLDGHSLRETSKHKPSSNQSFLPSATTKQLKAGEMEGVATLKEVNKVDKVVKATRDRKGATSEDGSHIPEKKCRKVEKAEMGKTVKAVGVQEGQTSEGRPERSKRPKKHQKLEDSSMPELKKDSHDDNDDEPFIELIGQKEPGKAFKEHPSRGRKKEESGLVSIIQNQSKGAKQKKSAHTVKTSSEFSISIGGGGGVGDGGPSSWN